jgi:hypothetical protein
MFAQRPRWVVCRAVIAVAALYALALQAVLGGATPIGITGPAGVLCLQHVGAADDGQSKVPADHAHQTCCIAAHVAPSVVAPVIASATIVWPERRTERVDWRPEVVTAARAPPGVSAGARAPPVA